MGDSIIAYKAACPVHYLTSQSIIFVLYNYIVYL